MPGQQQEESSPLQRDLIRFSLYVKKGGTLDLVDFVRLWGENEEGFSPFDFYR